MREIHRWIPSQRPVTRSFCVFFDLRLNKRFSKQSRRRWFGTPSRSLWHHCNENVITTLAKALLKICEKRCSFKPVLGRMMRPNLSMMTSSNGNIFHVTGHLCGEFTGLCGEFPAQRPVTRNFGVFFDLCLNKRLKKQSWGWWFETLYGSLWLKCNANNLTTLTFGKRFTIKCPCACSLYVCSGEGVSDFLS